MRARPLSTDPSVYGEPETYPPIDPEELARQIAAHHSTLALSESVPVRTTKGRTTFRVTRQHARRMVGPDPVLQSIRGSEDQSDLVGLSGATLARLAESMFDIEPLLGTEDSARAYAQVIHAGEGSYDEYGVCAHWSDMADAISGAPRAIVRSLREHDDGKRGSVKGWPTRLRLSFGTPRKGERAGWTKRVVHTADGVRHVVYGGTALTDVVPTDDTLPMPNDGMRGSLTTHARQRRHPAYVHAFGAAAHPSPADGVVRRTIVPRVEVRDENGRLIELRHGRVATRSAPSETCWQGHDSITRPSLASASVRPSRGNVDASAPAPAPVPKVKLPARVSTLAPGETYCWQIDRQGTTCTVKLGNTARYTCTVHSPDDRPVARWSARSTSAISIRLGTLTS